MGKITERVQFLAEPATVERLEQALRELKDAGVKPPRDAMGPNRVTVGWILRECVERHLDATLRTLKAEHGQPAPKSKRRSKP